MIYREHCLQLLKLQLLWAPVTITKIFQRTELDFFGPFNHTKFPIKNHRITESRRLSSDKDNKIIS